MRTQLDQCSQIVADTGDFSLLSTLASKEVTTNPSLLWKALQQPNGASLLQHVFKRFSYRKKTPSLNQLMDQLSVHIACRLLEQVPGRVSTEIDPRLSFDTAATLARSRGLAAMYRAEGIPLERVLIKIAATWEGIQAAKQLELEGIRTNLTLVFSFAQAVA